MSAFLSQLVNVLLWGILLVVSGATFIFMMVRLKPCEHMFRAEDAERGTGFPAEKIVRRRAKK